MYIPEDITEFLYWVKERTEAYWAKEYNGNDDEFYCEDWAIGAKWIGMEESEIDTVELKYGIKFTPDHRLFLRILHTIDRKRVIYDSFEDDSSSKPKKYPFFYNWFTDGKEISERFQWPYETILQDVLGVNNGWIESWGKKPQDKGDQIAFFDKWYANVPKLIPLTSHRFIVSDPIQESNPVLSVWGLDTIVYGWNLRFYLLNELHRELDLLEYVFDEEDQTFYAEPKKEIQFLFNNDFHANNSKQIPYWSDLLDF